MVPVDGPRSASLTMLVEMMGSNTEDAVHQLVAMDINQLDLKNHVFGYAIEHLDDVARQKLQVLIETTATGVYCFSSTLGHVNVSNTDERSFRNRLDAGIANMLQTAQLVRPQMIRLLACSFDERRDYENSNLYLQEHRPWVYGAYRDAIDQIHEAGIAVTIENEPNTIFSNPGETVEFFRTLSSASKVGFTWDIQNMWQSGTFPTLDVYRQLRPITNYVHFKGGRASAESPATMTYRSLLEDADWPVREITAQILADGTSPVLCLNHSHGIAPENYRFARMVGTPELIRQEAIHNIAFLRETFQELS